MKTFDSEEKELLEAFEGKKLITTKKSLQNYRKYAVEHFARDKRINIRISSHDLLLLKQKAMEEGLPYQTLVSSVLHKFVNQTRNVH